MVEYKNQTTIKNSEINNSLANASNTEIIEDVKITSRNYNSYAPTKTGTGASGTWGISITGNAATATTASACSGNAASATKLATARTLTIGSTGKTFDGTGNVSWTLAEIGAAASSHSHSYLPISGGTLTGSITLPGSVVLAKDASYNALRVSNPSGYIQIGPLNEGLCHLYTDRPSFYFNKPLSVNGTAVSMAGHTHSYAPLTGAGTSGTWGISITGSSASCTGNAATATTASNSSKLGGLSLGNTTQGSHPGANAVVRTDANGYLNVGWINTVSGTATGTPTRIYCSQDAYLRYYAPDNATLRRSMKAYITYGTSLPSSGMSTGDFFIKI